MRYWMWFVGAIVASVVGMVAADDLPSFATAVNMIGLGLNAGLLIGIPLGRHSTWR